MNGPGTGSPELARAGVLVELQRWDEAIALLGQVVASDPSAARPRCLLAQALLGAGQPAAALEQARAASASDPYHEWPHRLQSIALHNLRDLRGSAAAAREAVRRAPAQANPYIVLTDAELALRRLAAAKAAADKAVELAPGLFSAHLAVGRVELAKHNNRAAEAHFREALRLNPESAAAINDLGRALLGQGRFRSAIAYFGQASRVNPHEDVFRRNAVRGAIRAGWARVVVCAAVVVLGAAVASGSWNAAIDIAVALVVLAAGVAVRRKAQGRPSGDAASGAVGPAPEPTVGHDVLRSLRRQATLKDIVAVPVKGRDRRLVMRARFRARLPFLLVMGAGTSLLAAWSAVSGIVSPDPADPTSPAFYWGLLVVSSGFAVAAAVAVVVLLGRRR